MRHYQRRRRTGALADVPVPCRTRGWQPRWPSGEVDHVTSSGVAVDVLEHGDVLVSTGDRGMVALTNTQWRELAAYALAWVSCGEGDGRP